MNNIARGLLFEAVVKKLLELNDYASIPDDNQTVKNGRIRGRGTWHQIDAFGRFSFTIPFIYPIRLLAEAKWYTRYKAGLNTLRNFVGALKDISENYFVENGQSVNEKLLFKRYTDCGAVFSASGFSRGAQEYAYAQGVFLVSYENHPIMEDVLRALDPLLDCINLKLVYKKRRDFSRWFYDQLSGNRKISRNDFIVDDKFFDKRGELKSVFDEIRLSAIGITSGIYPIHLLSRQELPVEVFKDTDERRFRVHLEKAPNSLRIVTVDPPKVELFCSIPEELVLKHTACEMLKFKRKFFEYIDLPIKIGGIRRILRLNLDERWVKKLEDKAKARKSTRVV